ncbi:DUF1775 domain-containing protein, partial [Naasia lichenicola]
MPRTIRSRRPHSTLRSAGPGSVSPGSAGPGSTAIRGAGIAVVALALALGAPLAASAHVHVDPENAEPGEYALLTFRVPNESATATTTSVEIQLPTDTPFSYAAVEPVEGWDAQVVTSELPAPVDVDGTTISEAPTSILFTATGTGIGDG